MRTDLTASHPNTRRVELEAFAGHYGFRFLPDLSPASLPEDPHAAETRLLSRFSHMWPFHESFHRHVKHLAHGTYAGLDWTIFDYAPPHAPMSTHGAVCARLPVDLPSLHLCPENLILRLEGRLGAHALTLECEEFNERYCVRTDCPRQAFDVLHPQALDYLLALPPRHWQMHGCQLVLAQKTVYGADELPKVMGEIDGFVRLIPGYVLEDRAMTPDWKGPFG